jgi:putative tricarboxylic transport membrane protein
MKYPEVISGIFWLFIGIFFCVWSIHSYRIGSLTKPGPGFFPFLLSILMILLSLMWLKEAKKRFPITFGGLKKVAFTILILLLAALLFETIGYFLTVFLLIVFLMMVGTELKSWKKIIITALLTAIGVYIVFVLLLEQPFPRGLLRI